MSQPGACSMILRSRAEKVITAEFGDPAISGSDAVDMTGTPHSEIVTSLRTIVGTGLVVLHGSSFGRTLNRLEPHQANDLAKTSGNQKSVYATVEVEVALFYALVNREYIGHRFGSFTLGYGLNDGRRVFKATRNIYELFLKSHPDLYVDGFVYLLDKSTFRKAPDSATEYQAQESVAPLRVLRVPKHVGRSLFVVGNGANEDNVVEYGDEESYIRAVSVAELVEAGGTVLREGVSIVEGQAEEA